MLWCVWENTTSSFVKAFRRRQNDRHFNFIKNIFLLFLVVYNSMNFLSKIKHFHSGQNVFKMLSAKQRPFCIGHNVSSVMLAKLSSTKRSSDCRRTGHSLIELLTESLTHLLTDWITNWQIDCLIDWLAQSCLGSLKNREDCYTRWTPRNKYSLLFLICLVTMV